MLKLTKFHAARLRAPKLKILMLFCDACVICIKTIDCNCFNLLCNFVEFQKIAMATAIGFAIMGFIGFFVKLIHIPINNIIV